MSEALAAFHFERPYWLLLLLPAGSFWLLVRHFLDAGSRWQRLIDPELLRHLLVGQDKSAWVTPNGLLLFAWIMATLAVAGPAWKREPSPFTEVKPPVVVVLKVTPSMTTSDLAPMRLDRARQKLTDLLAAREGASSGLIAYSGSAHLVLPPTPDASVLKSLAQALAPDIMPKEGDSLTSALAMADRLLAGGARGGSILLMADSVAGDQLGRLRMLELVHPVTVLAMLPPELPVGALGDLAGALGASLVATSIDQSDIDALARRLDRSGRREDVAGEGQHWQEAGYWLTPLLALIALLWFRQGWVTG